jgi:hypothetical protein
MNRFLSFGLAATPRVAHRAGTRSSAAYTLWATLAIALALTLVPSNSQAQDLDFLAATGDFSTSAGTVQANGHIAGKPIGARTFFNRPFFDLPEDDAEDPLGTARHELFHGIGFAAAYDLFSAHIRVAGGERRFNTTTDGSGSDIAVLTDTTTHLDPDDYTGLGKGGVEQDQTCFLMTPAPTTGCAVPYPVDNLDRDILNSAFSWGTTGGIVINVVFDNSFGVWTNDEKTRINTAVADDRGVFGATNGTNNFTWVVSFAPEPGPTALGASSFILVIYAAASRKLKSRRRSN